MSNLQRETAESLVLIVSLDQAEDAIKEALANAYNTQKMLEQFLAGDFNFEDYLEAVEPFVPSIDGYIEEAEESLEEIQNKWVHKQLIL